MELDIKERLFLANQLKILEKLYPEEADYYSQQRTAIESGYELHYRDLFQNIYDEMSEEECREVLDILDMYRAMTFYFNHLSDKNDIDEERLKFDGFDGNEEIKQYSYAKYFIIDLQRFDELRYGLSTPDFNSHMPRLCKYRKMLEVWRRYDKTFDLSKESLNEILEA